MDSFLDVIERLALLKLELPDPEEEITVQKSGRGPEIFRRFPSFPIELRLQIWKYCFPRGELVYAHEARRCWSRGLTPMPITLSINQESRSETLANYIIIFPKHKTWWQHRHLFKQNPKPLCFNPLRDRLVFFDNGVRDITKPSTDALLLEMASKMDQMKVVPKVIILSFNASDMRMRCNGSCDQNHPIPGTHVTPWQDEKLNALTRLHGLEQVWLVQMVGKVDRLQEQEDAFDSWLQESFKKEREKSKDMSIKVPTTRYFETDTEAWVYLRMDW